MPGMIQFLLQHFNKTMNIHLVELKPEGIIIDELKFPNKEQDVYIYDHLRYYCSKLNTLPAISIKIIDDVIFASSRSQYLAIAKELNRDRIQAVIDLSSSKEDITKILDKPYVVQLDPTFGRLCPPRVILREIVGTEQWKKGRKSQISRWKISTI